MKRRRIDDLPPEVRRWLEKSLTDRNFSGYALFPELLREMGYTISRSAVHRFGKNLQEHLDAVRASTEAARMLTEGEPDDQDRRSEGIISVIQSEMFKALMNLKKVADDETAPAERIDLLSKTARNVAALSRASVNQKKFRHEIEARAAVAADKAAKLATKGGASPELVAEIRKSILGIAA